MLASLAILGIFDCVVRERVSERKPVFVGRWVG